MSDDDTENYLKERKLLIDAQQQSCQQLDKAILTLSSGGLGVSIVFLRDILPLEQIANYCFLIGSWILFTISITCTLVSFLTSHYAYDEQLELINRYFLNKESDAPQQFSFWKFSRSSTTRNSKKDRIAIVFLKKYVTFFTSYRVKYSHKMMIVCAKQNSSP